MLEMAPGDLTPAPCDQTWTLVNSTNRKELGSIRELEVQPGPLTRRHLNVCILQLARPSGSPGLGNPFGKGEGKHSNPKA